MVTSKNKLSYFKLISSIGFLSLIIVTLLTGCSMLCICSRSSYDTKISKLTFDQMTSYVHQQQGHPVLVNFWATWCDPCVEELPDLIKLYNKYHPEGIEFVGFSIDFPEDTEKVVQPFVKSHGIPYPVYVANPDDQDTLIRAFSPDWSGAAPATFLYDEKGTLLKAKFGKMTFKQMEEFIRPVLPKLN